MRKTWAKPETNVRYDSGILVLSLGASIVAINLVLSIHQKAMERRKAHYFVEPFVDDANKASTTIRSFLRKVLGLSALQGVELEDRAQRENMLIPHLVKLDSVALPTKEELTVFVEKLDRMGAELQANKHHTLAFLSRKRADELHDLANAEIAGRTELRAVLDTWKPGKKQLSNLLVKVDLHRLAWKQIAAFAGRNFRPEPRRRVASWFSASWKTISSKLKFRGRKPSAERGS